MEQVKGLKAIISVSECGNVIVLAEISGNEMFKEDIKHYNGCADDIFHNINLPDKFGFYLFIGQADCYVDDNGNVDDVEYAGFIKEIGTNDLLKYLDGQLVSNYKT